MKKILFFFLLLISAVHLNAQTEVQFPKRILYFPNAKATNCTLDVPQTAVLFGTKYTQSSKGDYFQIVAFDENMAVVFDEQFTASTLTLTFEGRFLTVEFNDTNHVIYFWGKQETKRENAGK